MSGIRVALLAALAALLAGASGIQKAGDGSGDERDAYVLILTPSDTSPASVLERYPEITGTWDAVAEYNLLRPGSLIEVNRAMLTREKLLAKVAGFYGETEVRRSFDERYIPVVKNLLLREGDVVRTWRKSGGRLLFEDGSFVLLKANSRAKLSLLGGAEGSSPSQVRLELIEGSLWSRIEQRVTGSFEIKTPSASTLIRGTDFRLKVEGDIATRLEVLQGTVELTTDRGSVSVAAGKGILSHTDESLGRPFDLPRAPDELLAPQPKQVFRGESFDEVFRWNAVAGAAGYRIEIARDAGFFDLVEDRLTGTEPLARIVGLEPGTYFWRVTVLDTRGFESPPAGDSYFVVVETQP